MKILFLGIYESLAKEWLLSHGKLPSGGLPINNAAWITDYA